MPIILKNKKEKVPDFATLKSSLYWDMIRENLKVCVVDANRCRWMAGYLRGHRLNRDKKSVMYQELTSLIHLVNQRAATKNPDNLRKLVEG